MGDFTCTVQSAPTITTTVQHFEEIIKNGAMGQRLDVRMRKLKERSSESAYQPNAFYSQ